MRKFLGTLKKFGKDEDGAALVEYAVLLGVLVAATIAAITALSTGINGLFAAMTAILTAA